MTSQPENQQTLLLAKQSDLTGSRNKTPLPFTENNMNCYFIGSSKFELDDSNETNVDLTFWSLQSWRYKLKTE